MAQPGLYYKPTYKIVIITSSCFACSLNTTELMTLWYASVQRVYVCLIEWCCMLVSFISVEIKYAYCIRVKETRMLYSYGVMLWIYSNRGSFSVT